MRKSRFTEEQMVAIVRKADREPAADVKRLKALEAENARLKKLVAKRDLEIEVMKEVAAKKMVSVPARRKQVEGARALGSAGLHAVLGGAVGSATRAG